MPTPSRPWAHPLAALLALATLLALTQASAQAPTPTLRGRHATEQLRCVDCHRVDKPESRPAEKACDRCHDHGELAKASANTDPNPHDSHQGQIRCTLCHRVHQPSELVCNECHAFDLKVP